MQLDRAEASRWARVSEETTGVSATNKSTYNSFSKVRESKMSGGSSVRSLKPRSLKPTRNRNSQPSLSVGHTELTALLHFICFQESFKRGRRRTRVLEPCSWSRPGLNHELCRQRVSTRANTRARNKSSVKPFHTNTYIHTYMYTIEQ